MSSGISEFVILPLKAGSNVADPSTPEGSILQDCLNTVLGVEGCQRVFWGIEEENPTNARWIVDWDSLDAHKKYMASPEYQPFVKNLMSILDSKPIVYHVGLKPHPATRCLSGAPITEIVNFYVDPSADSETGASNIEKFSKVMTELDINTDPSHFTGSAYGLTLDEHSDATAKASGKTKSWVILAGWGSIDDHNKSSGSQEVKDAMPLLMELPGLKDITAVHVKLQVIEGGSIGAAGGLGAGERGALPGNAQEEVLNPHDQSSGGVKTRSDGSTTKTQDGIPQHKERAGRGGETGYHHSGGPKGN